MAQFFGLIPLNAENFESGEATDGQVLSADGSGGASWETVEGGGSGDVQGEDVLSSFTLVVPSAVVVSGAGTANCNGEYTYDGYIDNKPSYVKGDFKIVWNSMDGYFLLMSGQIAYYGSGEDVLSPDLVSEWEVGDGEEPAPTVTASVEMEVVRNVDAGKVLSADGAGGASWLDALPVPDPLMYDLILSGTNTDADGTYRCSFRNGQYNYEREDNSAYKIAFSGVWSIYKIIDPFENTVLYYYSAISRLPRPDLIPLDKWYKEQGGDQPPILTKTNGRANSSNPSYVFRTDVDEKTLIWGFGS